MHRIHLRQLNQTIAVAHRSGVDGNKTPSYATATTGVAARVEPMDQQSDGPGGGERRTTHLVITATEVRRDSRVWLPPDDLDSPLQAAKGRIPYDVKKRINEDGTTSHWEVEL